MDKKKLLDYCLEEARNGKDFGTLREELRAFELQPKEIDQIIKYVDDHLLNQAFSGARRSHRREYLMVGWFLLIVGVLATVLTYTGVINMGDSYLIVYGPIIAGLGLIVGNQTEV
ncbi:hypothetical protein BFP97_03520 [Roseivirga sp. 4D4]|uniref:hypothetical protein n=1 Tax=Roseivirga sp. 4D4 TaxID=1889784 RepID=UPI000853B1ED|nr:hypothetical protein [Roseivirga sp. 4D4]OEK00629.1 hypothetical protein BFP97_03520 [Roseivirga sp. 4D4]